MYTFLFNKCVLSLSLLYQKHACMLLTRFINCPLIVTLYHFLWQTDNFIWKFHQHTFYFYGFSCQLINQPHWIFVRLHLISVAFRQISRFNIQHDFGLGCIHNLMISSILTIYIDCVLFYAPLENPYLEK